MDPFIPLTELAEVDSTSSYAMRCLREGSLQAPFAVTAVKQTAGRGRRDHQWVSPVGNLYLSIALSVEGWSPDDLARLPLQAAALVSLWLRERFGVRFTIKWPNDILFGGAKIGGILCEAATQGEKVFHAVVGIGINVHEAPDLEGAGYEASTLAAVLGSEVLLDPRQMATELTKFWSEQTLPFNAALTNKLCEESGVEIGQIWREVAAPGRYFVTAGLDAQGGLKLSHGAQAIKLTSVRHGFQWIYQSLRESTPPVLVVDVGNTATKVALFLNAHAEEPDLVVVTSGYDDLVRALTELKSRLPDAPWPLHVASVNSERLSLCEKAAAAAGLRLCRIPKRGVRRRIDSAYQLAELGADRLAAIEGALASPSNTKIAKVVVSAGTATTVDVVMSNGEHCGGWILPGLQTSLSALHAHTGGLPALNLREEWGAVGFQLRSAPMSLGDILGHSTREAMTKGAVVMTIGLLQLVRDQISRELSCNINEIDVFITGGWGEVLTAAIPEATFQPRLVLKGLRTMVLGGNRLDPKV